MKIKIKGKHHTRVEMGFGRPRKKKSKAITALMGLLRPGSMTIRRLLRKQTLGSLPVTLKNVRSGLNFSWATG
jgi:hypothetical protein